jgi:hypothetical protein
MKILSGRIAFRLVAAAVLSVGISAAAIAAYPARTAPAGTLLRMHNAARAAAGASRLTWDPQLEAEAAGYARYLASRNLFMHSSRSSRADTGENLWMGTRGAFPIESMVGGWLSEGNKFRAGIFPAVSRNGNWHEVGHYTQMVWPQTRRVGCALASNRSFDFLVCRYWPSGNVHGQPVGAVQYASSRTR